MWLKSCNWVDVPHTRYERRQVLNVRESRHSFMLCNPRYQNIDTGKFCIDKIPSIKSYSLADIMEDTDFGYGTKRNNYWYDEQPEVVVLEERGRRITIPKFVPKPDMFDEEEKQEKAALAIKQEEERLRATEIVKAQIAVEQEKARLKSILNEHVYAAVLAEAEARAVAMNKPIMFHSSQPTRYPSVAYIVKNKWSGPK